MCNIIICWRSKVLLLLKLNSVQLVIYDSDDVLYHIFYYQYVISDSRLVKCKHWYSRKRNMGY